MALIWKRVIIYNQFYNNAIKEKCEKRKKIHANYMLSNVTQVEGRKLDNLLG